MSFKPALLVGVDGGGSGTRVRLARPDGSEVGYGTAGPSGLSLGAEGAWASIHQALDQAFEMAAPLIGQRPAWNDLSAGMGLAGVSHLRSKEAFLTQSPPFGHLVLESDAFTTLLGAHGGQPGAVLAVGTGSIGLAWWADGRRQQVGGWGFPSSDEGSGAWLGLQAVQRVQWELDGRAQPSPLGRSVIQALQSSAGSVRDWLAQANQTAYAALAPVVLDHAHEPEARALLQQAALHLERIVLALDPHHELPIALCGGLAEALRLWLPEPLRHRLRTPVADSAQGALWLARMALREGAA
ncbi:MAG: hypothetical protein RI949_351 [Pseudomonadota bacterium]|jgi:glucosamine kinase